MRWQISRKDIIFVLVLEVVVIRDVANHVRRHQHLTELHCIVAGGRDPILHHEGNRFAPYKALLIRSQQVFTIFDLQIGPQFGSQFLEFLVIRGSRGDGMGLAQFRIFTLFFLFQREKRDRNVSRSHLAKYDGR